MSRIYPGQSTVSVGRSSNPANKLRNSVSRVPVHRLLPKTEAVGHPETEPLPDDEHVIADGQAIDFWVNVVALIDRYTVVQHAQAAAKKMGYEVVPGDATFRVLMYRELKSRAAKRDAEDAETKAEKEAE